VHGRDTPKVAEFAFDEADPSDRVLIRAGAVFYWSIGYNVSAAGQVERTSSLYFRRLPVRRQLSPNGLRGKARELAARVGWRLPADDVEG
jgi:hypothetical protein